MSNVPITLYLLFQIFVSGSSSILFPPQAEIEGSVRDISSRIGTTGDKHSKLGFVVGPISFNQDDAEVKRLISDSFSIARKTNTAVGFHIDDSMFWEKRTDLLNDKANIEWTDWNASLCTGRKLDWGKQPTKVAPQLCFNSAPVKKAVRQRAYLIGTEVNRELQRLKKEGREELFAGIIAGWETQIGRDFDTNLPTGYHALYNAGFRSSLPSAQSDSRRVEIVKDFIKLWADALAEAGIPSDKIYAHIAFTPQGFDAATPASGTYEQQVFFADPSVAFAAGYRPGFSTYPDEGALTEIQKVVAAHNNPPWISAEGTNVVPSGMKGEADMESYLAKLFNHNAVMVNIFSWGMGGEANKNNFFRQATESEEAIFAYRKFLTGKSLQEKPRSAGQFSPARMQQKMHQIQVLAPVWVQRTKRLDIVKTHIERVESALKANRFEDAEREADQLLQLIKAQ